MEQKQLYDDIIVAEKIGSGVSLPDLNRGFVNRDLETSQEI